MLLNQIALLPRLQPLIHDSNEKVRKAFVQLLAYIKGIQTILFDDIVPLEHLLHRLCAQL